MEAFQILLDKYQLFRQIQIENYAFSKFNVTTSKFVFNCLFNHIREISDPKLYKSSCPKIGSYIYASKHFMRQFQGTISERVRFKLSLILMIHSLIVLKLYTHGMVQYYIMSIVKKCQKYEILTKIVKAYLQRPLIRNAMTDNFID